MAFGDPDRRRILKLLVLAVRAASVGVEGHGVVVGEQGIDPVPAVGPGGDVVEVPRVLRPVELHADACQRHAAGAGYPAADGTTGRQPLADARDYLSWPDG